MSQGQESSGYRVITRYADAVEVLRNAAAFSSRIDPRRDEDRAPLLSELDPVAHDRVRRPVLRALSRKVVDGLRPAVRGICEDVLHRLPDRGRADLIAAVVSPALQRTLAALLGIADHDIPRVFGWAAESTDHAFTRGGEAAAALDGFVLDLVRARRARSGEDAVSLTIAAGERQTPPLSDAEVAAQVRSLIMAGHGATVDLLGTVLHQMLVAPEWWERAHADRTFVPTLVEEALRFEAPATVLTRRCVRDTRVDAELLREGDVVMIALGLANRDPAVHEDPDSFAPDRTHPENHLSFGEGPHTCVGIPLVRLLVSVLLDALLDRYPQPLSLSEGFQYRHSTFFITRGPQRLDVDLAVPAR